jgi:hypothetical protein
MHSREAAEMLDTLQVAERLPGIDVKISKIYRFLLKLLLFYMQK